MHLWAAIAQAAGVAKYLAPVSDTSCRVTARFMVPMVLLYDVRRLFMFDASPPTCRRRNQKLVFLPQTRCLFCLGQSVYVLQVFRRIQSEHVFVWACSCVYEF